MFITSSVVFSVSRRMTDARAVYDFLKRVMSDSVIPTTARLINPDTATLKANACCQPRVPPDPKRIKLMWYAKFVFYYIGGVETK